jgi:hypothetical protein
VEVPTYSLDASGWSMKKYGREFLVTRIIGREISRLLQPGETFYAWANDPGLYFWSGRRPVTIGMGCRPLIFGPLAERLNRQVLEELEREKPELFVGDSHELPPPGTRQPVIHWIMQHYDWIPGFSDRGDFVLLVLHDGKLQKRLLSTSKT